MYFFFFKQKTAYEMRISDWSSDVCSSDLLRHATGMHHAQGDLADVRRQRRQVGLRAHDLEGAPGDLLRVADVAVEGRGHGVNSEVVHAAPPPPHTSALKGKGEGWRDAPISPPPLWGGVRSGGVPKAYVVQQP